LFLESYFFDAPPHSLKDSNANPKMKITEKGIGVAFLNS
jgi:hypothetical protein